MGLVRFEHTIDGSLRLSVLQRIIIIQRSRPTPIDSADPLFIIYRWSPSPFLTRPQPLHPTIPLHL
ncbi:MAG: hypothetical protein SCAL_001434 [Candidatus Syntrophoarchaeum caldarius]|uniref:Uncharacterized protein n=1 Tax=Candidatus Syntropharchaeum caldarium TaxID=1838285 RepID=A0A1F2PA80_9EURY|nr:MAG: hypothetical protein SCAL_001434 [Candidatus Syntrophoarchaeum caldarius]